MTETAAPDPQDALKDFSPFKTRPSFAERVWGRKSLAPWYAAADTDQPVGEAWLTGPDCVAETGEFAGKKLSEIIGDFPLLVKVLFPDDKLSVQVHPDDVEAQALGLPRGKTECWYVLAAEPGAKVACGLKSGVDKGEIESSVADGTLEEKLEFLPVSPGDMVYVDAGTVHAIGPGMTLLEVQQTCDVTYRIFDYGRKRDLHLAEALAVIKLTTDAGKVKPHARNGYTRLIETPFFEVDRFELPAGMAEELPFDGLGCLVCIRGAGAVNEVRFAVGEAVVVPDGSVTLTTQAGCTFLRCVVPAKDEDR